jgi:hypothetical protein
MMRLPGWLQVAAAACTSITRSSSDIAAIEEDVAELWRASRTVTRITSVAQRLGAAWSDSRTRAIVRWIAR